jgi:ribosomal protein S18 acetylase RimI-like enzyme
MLVTTYLEMTNPAEFKPGYSNDPNALILEVSNPLASFYRYLYAEVGSSWMWRDRLVWSDDQLSDYLRQPNITLHVLYVGGNPAGYIEMDHQAEDIEIVYFGLLPAFIGRGYGKHLLSYGIQAGWDRGVSRIWLHTCNLDGPHALKNYQARGFKIFDVKETPMPTFEPASNA